VKEIEKRDSVLTSKQQIERLLRPGSSYFNLNPFEGNHLSLIKIPHLQLNNPFIVLQLEPETPVDQIKKKYRSLSILVHPDKNVEEMRDRAQQAFEVVNKAWKVLENEVTRKKCLEVYEEAKDRTDLMVTF
jgi:DnaJ family protein C protein 8